MRGNGRARYERYSKTAHRRRGVLTRRGLSTSPSLNPLAPQDGEDASVHSHDSESSHSMSLDHAADPPHNHDVPRPAPRNHDIQPAAGADIDARVPDPADDAPADNLVLDADADEEPPAQMEEVIFNNDDGGFALGMQPDEVSANAFDFNGRVDNVMRGIDDAGRPPSPPDEPIIPVINGVLQQEPNLEEDEVITIGQGPNVLFVL